MDISTTLHQLKRPEPIEVDSRGSKISIGANVAYNKSGSVKLGKILSIDKNEWDDVRIGSENKKWWSLRLWLTIEGEDGSISKVKNANSFVIL